jgi:hypothetical protein
MNLTETLTDVRSLLDPSDLAHAFVGATAWRDALTAAGITVTADTGRTLVAVAQLLLPAMQDAVDPVELLGDVAVIGTMIAIPFG